MAVWDQRTSQDPSVSSNWGRIQGLYHIVTGLRNTVIGHSKQKDYLIPVYSIINDTSIYNLPTREHGSECHPPGFLILESPGMSVTSGIQLIIVDAHGQVFLWGRRGGCFFSNFLAVKMLRLHMYRIHKSAENRVRDVRNEGVRFIVQAKIDKIRCRLTPKPTASGGILCSLFFLWRCVPKVDRVRICPTLNFGANRQTRCISPEGVHGLQGLIRLHGLHPLFHHVVLVSLYVVVLEGINTRSGVPIMTVEDTKTPRGIVMSAAPADDGLSAHHEHQIVDNRSSKVPWTMKVLAVLLVSSIGFGSHWSSGVTGAMKATLKKASTNKHFRATGMHLG